MHFIEIMQLNVIMSLQSATCALSLNLTKSHRTNKTQTTVAEVGSCPSNNIQSLAC